MLDDTIHGEQQSHVSGILENYVVEIEISDDLDVLVTIVIGEINLTGR